MKKIIRNIAVLSVVGFAGTSVATAQVAQQKVGDNPTIINPNAVLELESADKGLLLPRLALTSTNSFAPLTAHVEGMTVYNTVTAGTDETEVTPGYYYNDGTQWVRIATITDAAIDANNGLTKTGNVIQLGGELIQSTSIVLDGNELEIDATDSDLVISGLDKTTVQTTVNGATTTGITDHLLAVGADDQVKALKAAMPKFFYMPSIIIPTSNEQLQADGSGALTADSFDDSTRQGSISLYGRYEVQFGTPMESNVGATTQLPVLPATELDYHITWYDTTVFETVEVTNNGVLNYEVKDGVDVTMGSFMNIVFAVK